MARLHRRIYDEDGDLPELDALVKRPVRTKKSPGVQNGSKGGSNLGFGDTDIAKSIPIRAKAGSTTKLGASSQVRQDSNVAAPRRQRPLKLLQSNSFLQKPFDTRRSDNGSKTMSKPVERLRRSNASETDNKSSSSSSSSSSSTRTSLKDSSTSDPEDSLAEIDFWIKQKSPLKPTCSGLISELSPKSPRKERAFLRDIRRGRARESSPSPLDISLGTENQPSSSSLVVSKRPTTPDSDHEAILTFNPTIQVSPRKPSLHSQSRSKTPPSPNPSGSEQRPGQKPQPKTPPASPTKFKIPSPTKPIPTLPATTSTDEFWSQSIVTKWNEQFSPRKIVASPRKQKYRDDFIHDSSPSSPVPSPPPSPTASPRKNPASSPRKPPAARTAASPKKSEREAKKAFAARRQALAESFLQELDDKITGGRIAELTASTGGVQIVWSRTLNSTAGRANWRRERHSRRSKDKEGGGALREVVLVKQHAKIELAEKVISDEDRLVNTLAHEFCHLATYMVSGVKNNPHGKEFKEWAAKCSQTFRHRNVLVTTKHSYTIEYKYVWTCTSCGTEYKRHSKSIDPSRHACGGCKAKLVQTKPAVRKTGPSEYQTFVKMHFQSVKSGNGGATQRQIMEIIGRMYKERKGTTGKGLGKSVEDKGDGVEQLIRRVEEVRLAD